MTAMSQLSKIGEFSSLFVFTPDLNGVARGKRLPGRQLGKVRSGKIRMPLSVPTLDIWGRDLEGNPLVFESGDADAVCQPVRDIVTPAPWLGKNAGLVPVWMFKENGAPSPTDARHALAAIVQRYADRGLTPVVATELEFFLTPRAQDSVQQADLLSLDQLADLSPLFDMIYALCEAAEIPADSTLSECGPGQFELNLSHRADALAAADDAMLFKHIVRGCARVHGYDATFMAKPVADAPGNGLHVHFSVLDTAGANIFDNGTVEKAPVLHHAVGGLVQAMAASTLIFAPHFNSFRRLRPGAHAPTAIAWGYENRTAAIRIPGGSPAASRIEHRVAGADANPYLVLSAVLGAALEGMEDEIAPPAPVSGNAYDPDLPQLPLEWSTAIARFQADDMLERLFNPTILDLITRQKTQEHARFLDQITRFERQTYQEII